MSTGRPPRRRAERLYGLLLRLYPRRTRRRFGAELEEVFGASWEAALRRDGRLGTCRLWLRAVRAALVDGLLRRSTPPIYRSASGPPLRAAGGGLLADLLADVRGALRLPASSPGFVVAVILTLALGIGASSAIFSVVDAVLLEPLPYPAADRLVQIWTSFPEHGTSEFPASVAEFLDYGKRTATFETIAASTRVDVVIDTDDGEPERIGLITATANLWDLLGARPLHGRLFDASDDIADGPDVVVLGHGLWRRRYGADPEIVGETLAIDGAPYEVIGVAEAELRYLDQEVPAWIPLGLDETLPSDRSGHFLDLIGRLGPGVSLTAARAEMDLVVERWREQYQHAHPFQAVPLKSRLVGDAERPLLVLLILVGAVLLTACVNVASMMLARSEERQQEMAVRKALGAGTGRLVRQLMTESFFLALVAGAVALFVAQWGTSALLALEPGNLPRIGEVEVDARVLGFTFTVSLLTGLAFGILPALRAAHQSIQGTLREGGGRSAATAGPGALQPALVTVEIALAVLLAVGAGLVARSFVRMLDVEPGIGIDGVVSARVGLPQARYPDGPAIVGFTDRLLDEAASIPGVESAGVIRRLPLLDRPYREDLVPAGIHPDAEGARSSVLYQVVTPGALATAGIGLLDGRDFEAGDRDGAPRVAIINRALARERFPGGAVGERIRILAADPDDVPFEIVGVIEDVHHRGVALPPAPQVFVPLRQAVEYTPWATRGYALVLRASRDADSVLPPLRRRVRSIDPQLALSNETTMERVASDAMARPRFLTLLLGIFSATALFLAAVGTYGVVSLGVARRRGEFGLRLALGAAPTDVLRLVVARGMIPVAAGLLLGTVAALAFGGLMTALLFETTAYDPLVYGVALGALTLTGAAATWVPACRAAAVEPATTLRT